MAEKTRESNKPHFLGKPVSRRPASRHWHAVAIKPKGQCCEAVQACRNSRFLSGDAPRLPLAECSTSENCTCVYKHHADRRAQPRRQDERDGLRRGGKVAQERRLTGDRRSGDREPDAES